MFRAPEDPAATMIILSDSPDNTDLVLSSQSLIEATIILTTALAIIVTNALIIATFTNLQGPLSEVLNCYLLSLAVADFLCGLLVVPMSIYPAIVHEWVYGDVLCRLLGYLEVTLWAVNLYTFMWIGVDRYLAIRKPLRYETIQTRTRCQCWMAFTWISSAMLCCPPLLSFNTPIFNEESHICMLDWGSMVAYSATMAILVLGPTLITIVYTYSYIFHMFRKVRSGAPFHDKEYATALAENLSNPSHAMTFALILVFCLSWTPFIFVKMYEYCTGIKLQMQYLQFGVVWLGFSNSFWKAVILILMSTQFRLALRIFCMTICCRYKGRMRPELIGMEADD